MHRFALASLLSTAACAGDNPFDQELSFSPPMTTRSHVSWIDNVESEIVFVEPGERDVSVSRQPLHHDRAVAAWATTTRDQSGLLVMSVPASAKDEDVGNRLLRFSSDGDEMVDYGLAAPFTSAALSPDLRRAVLYFGAQSELEHLQNANQVAVVDFATNAVRDLTLDGFGGRLQGVQFPAQVVPGQPGLVDVDGVLRDIVVFLVEGEVVLLDLDDPNASQVAVQFDDLPFTPVHTLLRPGDALFPRPTLFVRSSRGSDVATLTLVSKADGSGFTVQVSLVPVGGEATDVVAWNGADVPYLVTVSDGSLVFTDIRTGQSFDVSMGGSVERVFLRPATGDAGPVTQAVTWAERGDEIHTLELDAIENTLARRPRHLKVETGIDDLVRLDDQRVLVGSGSVLYIVDLDQEQVTPLTSALEFDPRSSALRGDTLLLGTAGQSWVSTIDLLTLNPESMVLDHIIESFHQPPDSNRAMLVHEERLGSATVIDAAAPSRSTSYTAWGFLASGVLEARR